MMFPEPDLYKYAFITATIALLAGASAPKALATEDTGNQNPDVKVSVSLASLDTDNPDVAAVGDGIRTTLSVENEKELDPFDFDFDPDEFRLNVTLQGPFIESYTVSFKLSLLPEQNLIVPIEYRVADFIPSGEYALTLEAFEVRDPAMPPSSATGIITIL